MSKVHKRWNCNGWRDHFTMARPGILPYSHMLVELAMDVETLMYKLPTVEQDICELIMQGYEFEEIRGKLGLTKRGFVAHFEHIRQVAKELCLDEYIAEGRPVYGC